MGTKRAGKGKYLFLYFACLVAILLEIQGCTNFTEKRQDKQNLADTKIPMDKEDDETPLKDFKEVLTLFPQFARKWQGKQTLAKARALMLNGYYESSLKNNKEVLRLFPNSLGDQALFQMGLNYAHPENPNMDYKKSTECFQNIIKEFPESNIRDKAGIWILFLQEITKKNKRINNLQNQIENLQYQIEGLKEIDLGIEEEKRKSLLK